MYKWVCKLFLLAGILLTGVSITGGAPAYLLTGMDQKHISRSKIKSVFFLDAKTVWVVTREGKVLRTIDGGQSWDELSSTIPAIIEKIYFINKSVGWAVSSEGRILKTGNGGETWQHLTILPPNNSASIYIRNIVFLDENIGFILGGTNIWKTNDGGKAWQNHSFATILKGGYGVPTNSLSVFFKSVWVPGRDELIHRSTDLGQSWFSTKIRRYGGGEYATGDIMFINMVEGWATLTPFGGLYKTTDGGENWHIIRSTAISNVNILAIDFLSSSEGWVAGETLPRTGNIKKLETERQGVILYTSDGGKSWRRGSSRMGAILKIKFFGRKEGWAVAPTGLYRTNNGGLTWNNVLKL